MVRQPEQPVAAVTSVLERARRPPWARVGPGALRFARTKPLGAFGAVILLAMIFLAAFAPWLSPYDPVAVRISDRLLPPLSTGASGFYLLGTDDLGRDILSRIIHGSRTAVTISFSAIILATTTATVIGVLSAYFGGKFDLIVQRFVDALFAFPLLVFALVIVSVLGPSMLNVIIALSVVLVPGESRTIRSQALSIMELPYIDATRAIGCGTLRTVLLHLVPNVAAVVIVLASIQLGAAIIVEATLSFLGLGTPPPTPSWGGMMTGSSRVYLEQAPWLAIIPGITISLAVLGINLLGDALRDVWDPRLRGT